MTKPFCSGQQPRSNDDGSQQCEVRGNRGQHWELLSGFPTVLCMEWDLLCGVMRKEGAGKPSHQTNMPLQKKVDNNQVPLGATARITAK
ncbi:hypothetical protein Pelo_5572 [Pelomyxa schiedti]|nr:hypothetical protein Pelo_5572 [Pelomyxa schiedti]